MTFHSLFLQTEMIFWQRWSEIEDLGNAVAIRTPTIPTWWWGNLLVLDAPPTLQEVSHWIDLFDTVIRIHPSTHHYLFIWEEGAMASEALEAFRERGIEYSVADVLTLGELQRPICYNAEIELRELRGDDPLWDEVVRVNVECFAPSLDDGRYEVYATLKIGQYQSLIDSGFGKWYAAMIGDEIAGSFGIFPSEGLYRFQEIAVREKFRKQGIASTMTYEAARQAKADHPEFTQVIVADPAGDSIRIYRALGFEQIAVSYALQMR